jgi:hypothetical protein
MKVVEVSLLDEVLLDLEAGRQFYNDFEPGVGEYFLELVFADIQSLRNRAGIHPRQHDHFRMLTKRFPFAVYYEVEKSLRSLPCST